MRRAIVTGVSRGIGRAVTEMLLDDGWDVLGISRTMPEPFCHEERFSWVSWDLSRPLGHIPDGVYTGPPSPPVTVLHDMQGPIDALIHAAAIRGGCGAFEESDPAAWTETVVTNLLGTANVVRAALPLLHRSDDGRILLFSGGGAFDPSPGYSAYAVSKAGVVSLMETLAEELRGTSVTVNCVAPGFVATHIHDGTPDAARTERNGAMDDVLGCVRHLLSPSVRGLTGKTVAAQFDDWPHLSPWVVDTVNGGPMGTRTRHPMQSLDRLLIQTLRTAI